MLGALKLAWLDSICVVHECRRQGVATALLHLFARRVPEFEWLGATTPNPITHLVLKKLQLGRIYGPGTPAPREVLAALDAVKPHVEDLKRFRIDGENMRIETGFNVKLSEQDRVFQKLNQEGGQTHTPPWRAELAHLPENWEGLLLIRKDARDTLD